MLHSRTRNHKMGNEIMTIVYRPIVNGSVAHSHVLSELKKVWFYI